MQFRYIATLTPEDEGGYHVTFEDVPGCFAVGETVDEALQDAAASLKEWLKYAIEKNKHVPAVTYIKADEFNHEVEVDVPVVGLKISNTVAGKRYAHCLVGLRDYTDEDEGQFLAVVGNEFGITHYPVQQWTDSIGITSVDTVAFVLSEVVVCPFMALKNSIPVEANGVSMEAVEMFSQYGVEEIRSGRVDVRLDVSNLPEGVDLILL